MFRKDTENKAVPTATPVPKTTIQIGETSILVELANTPESRALGLGNRDSLPMDEGMLFVFGEQAIPVNFWMKGMRFPLDMIFLANDRVVQIIKNAPPEPGVPDTNLKAYISTEPVNYVLEVNAGFVEKNDIKVGDSFTIN